MSDRPARYEERNARAASDADHGVLNEAQFYLDVTDGGLGERVAVGLRQLLRDPGRALVLVLATLWPEFGML